MEPSENLDARLRTALSALAAQESVIRELSTRIEKQADVIAGMSLVLRALIDTTMVEDQRQMLERHIEMSGSSLPTQLRSSIIEALLA